MSQNTPIFFNTASDFRDWLSNNVTSEHELIVGFWKVNSGRPCMTWSESVDEALCFGWIDAVRKRIDDDAYQIRFTVRKPNSIWSAVNIKKFEQLSIAGKMTEAGRKAYGFRTAARSVVYAHEQQNEAELSVEEINQFKSDASAWHYFENCPPGYRKLMLHWITKAKRAQTRTSRLLQLLDACRNNKRIT